MLNDRVGAGEHQGGVTVVETHQVGRLPARTADLDDLARPLRLAHDVATHVEPVPDDCLHQPTSSPAFALPVHRRTSARCATSLWPVSTAAPRPGTQPGGRGAAGSALRR